jgi:hypothetical protein
VVRPPPPGGYTTPFRKPTRGTNLNFPKPDLPNHSMDCSETSGIAGLPPGQPLPQRNRPESLTIKRNRRNGFSRSRTRPTRKTTKSSLIQSHQPKRHKILIRDTRQKPQEIVLKTPPNKELRKSPQRRTKKTLHNLEEQRRTIYTYHEGSYKV